MKRAVLTISAILVSMILMAFSPNNDYMFSEGFSIQIDNQTDITEGEWSDWQTTDCFKNLFYRVQKGRYNEYAKKWYWNLEFRNGYSKKIHFSYTMVEPEQEQETRDKKLSKYRKSLEVNETHKTDGLVNSTVGVFVYVCRVRFGEKDSYSDDYLECDK